MLIVLLYNSAVSGNCYKVRLLLAHLGVEYETVDVSVVDRSGRKELLGHLNPALRVPTLVLDDGRPLGESNAILWYFADGTQYLSGDPYERAQTLQWMFFEQYSHEPYIAVVRFWFRYSGTPERFADLVPEKTKGGYAALDALERGLEGRNFLVGGRYSIADISLYAYTHVAHEGDFDLDPYPAIRAWLERVAAQPGHAAIDDGVGTRSMGLTHRVPEVTVRVRFAPSPTGSLHLGNALTAVANRRFADAERGILVLRIDDTDSSRTVEGGEAAILNDLAWIGVSFEEGPVRQSERGSLYLEAAERALSAGAAERDPDGSIRLGRDGTTLLRADGTATYQLASVADDLELRITHVIRGNDHRPNLEIQQRIARAIGGQLPEVIHHGLVLGEDGKKLSKRHGHSSIAELRDEGFPAQAVRAYLDELDLPEHDVNLDLARLRRLAIDAIAAMSDAELSAAAGAPVEVVPVLRGARSLVEAREYARLVLEPPPARLPPKAQPTLDRFVELRRPAPDRLLPDESRAILRELKAVGGDLRSLRLALTGASTGPELSAVLCALSREDALTRAARAGSP